MNRHTIIFVLLLSNGIVYGQMPACITIDPPDATAYDSMTVTFNPAFSCYQWSSLAGVPQVFMHSGVTIGYHAWQYVIAFNQVGVNGQFPILNPNGDGTYSIHLRPSSFYGFPPGLNVSQLCIVFNDGQWNSKDGRDFLPGYSQCVDILVPLSLGPPSFSFTVNMQKAFDDGIFDPFNDLLFVAIHGLDTIPMTSTGPGQLTYGASIDSALMNGTTYNYKFRINELEYESFTRIILASPGITSIDTWWNNDFLPYNFQVIADFEDNTTGMLTLHVMGCGPWDDPILHPVSETFLIVDNPYPSPSNPSSKVMKFTRRGLNNGGQSWGGFWADCYPHLDISNLKYIHIKALKPRYSPLRFKIEAGTTGTLEVYSDNTQTLINEWEDYVFDFTSMDGTYPILCYMPDYEGPLMLAGDVDLYFDDIVLSDRPFQIYTGTPVNPKAESLLLFPNPARERVTLYSATGIRKIEVFDVNDKKESEISMESTGEPVTIDLSGVPNGLHILKITDLRGSVYFSKVIKYE
jgi:hypothetical protein